MGKSLPSTAGLKNFARIISSKRISPPKHLQPTLNNDVSIPISQSAEQPTKVARVDSTHQLRLKRESNSDYQATKTRRPLSEVVKNSERRWFLDTLDEARDGDPNMQILLGQMYNSGYGVHKDTKRGRIWIARASRERPYARKVSHKQPGYNVSDSESARS